MQSSSVKLGNVCPTYNEIVTFLCRAGISFVRFVEWIYLMSGNSKNGYLLSRITREMDISFVG